MESHQTVVKPYTSEQSKKEQVAQMFDNISPKYDFLNHLLSLGIDKGWRRRAVKEIGACKPQVIIDIATGTADFAIEAASLKPKQIIGVDISEGMLQIGRKKIQQKGLDPLITLQKGDAEHLPFEDNYADAITIGFGVRNFEHLQKGLSEIYRILKPQGLVVILEPAIPQRFPIKQLFHFYFKNILPLIGRMISKDNAAYNYLPNSVKAFPHGKEFLSICQSVGFTKLEYKPLTLGICAMYVLSKS